MKASIIKRFYDHFLLGQMQEFRLKKQLIYYAPVEWCLGGIYFESSSHSSTDFSIQVFIQPMFVPSEHISFRYGERLGMLVSGFDLWWKSDTLTSQPESVKLASSIRQVALPLVRKHVDLEGFIGIGSSFPRGVSKDPFHLEAMFYADILRGSTTGLAERGAAILGTLTATAATLPEQHYLRNVIDRVDRIVSLLTDSRSSAEDQLRKWAHTRNWRWELSSRWRSADDQRFANIASASDFCDLFQNNELAIVID